MTAIIIFCIVLCVSAICLPIIASIIESKRYNEYINSIKPGDVFVNELFVIKAPDDPFDTRHNRIDDGCYDEMYYTTVLDIKENKHGETWVKYCFTRALKYKHTTPTIFTESIDKYLKYRHRLDE
jgi:hypothetical protein